MAKNYRTFKRVRMTPVSAETLVNLLVNRTFDDHYGMVCRECGENASKVSNRCSKCGTETQKRRKHYRCEQGACSHTESRTLDCARLVEAQTKILRTRAYIDLPGDDADLLRLLADRCRSFAVNAGKSASAFLRVATAAENHARRGWLHQLAECALDVDQEHLGEE